MHTKSICFLLLLLCIALCAGCGSATAPSQESEAFKDFKEQAYQLKSYAVDKPPKDGILHVYGEKLYVSTVVYDKEKKVSSIQIHWRNADNTRSGSFCHERPGIWGVREFFIDAQENRYLYLLGADKVYLSKLDRENQLLWETDITAEVSAISQNPKVLFPEDIAADPTGRSCLRIREHMLCFSEDGSLCGRRAETEGQSYGKLSVIGEDIRVILDGEEPGEYVWCVLDVEKMQIKPMGECVASQPVRGYFTGEGEQDLYYYTMEAMYTCQPDDEARKLFDWWDYGIDGHQIRAAQITNVGGFIALWQDEETYEYQLLTLDKKEVADAHKADDRTALTLGVCGADSSVRSAVADFNRAQEEYRIELRDYQGVDGEVSLEDAGKRLAQELTAGDGPDFLMLDPTVMDIEEYRKKGVLADLTPFVENSVRLQEKGLFPIACGWYQYESGLAGIPADFSFRTLVMNRKLLEGQKEGAASLSGLTRGELMELCRAYEQEGMRIPASAEQLLWWCLACSWEEFVDEEAGECSFTSEQFLELLEFAGEHVGNESEELYGRMEPEQDAILYEVTVGSAADLLRLVRLYGEGQSAVIGYPTVTGRPAARLSSVSGEIYGINGASKHKEGAWAFIERQLVKEEKQIKAVGFPVTKEEVFALIDMLAQEESAGSQGLTAASEQELTEMKDIVEQLEAPGVIDEQISSIVREEIGHFLQGTKSASQTARVIQNRVSLYLSE